MKHIENQRCFLVVFVCLFLVCSGVCLSSVAELSTCVSESPGANDAEQRFMEQDGGVGTVLC